MEPIFKHTFPISDIYLDGHGRLKPSSILYFVQEAAGQHCNLLKVDWDTLAQQNLFWAVTRHRVQISRLPTRGETITVETWPMPTTKVAFPRSVVAYDENGKQLDLWFLYADPQVGQTFTFGTLIDNSDGNIAELRAFMLPLLGGTVPLANSVTTGSP